MKTKQARFSQNRNDMYWSHYDLDDGFIRWTGYDDNYWWGNVSKSQEARTRTGKVSGRIYEIDFMTGKVFVRDGSTNA